MRPAHRIDKLEAFEGLHGLKVASREPDLKLDPKAVAAVKARFANQPWSVAGAGRRRQRAGPHLAGRALRRRVARLADLFPTVFWLGGPNDAKPPSRDRGPDLPNDVVACDLPLDQSAALIALSAGFLGNDSDR
jgi:heptosyltransferase-2